MTAENIVIKMTKEDSNKENMMALTKEQEELYRKTMAEAKAQYDSIDEEMEKEIQKTRETLAKLQESKKSFQQIYVSTAKLLGIKVEVKTEDGSVNTGEGSNENEEEKKRVRQNKQTQDEAS